MAILFAFAAACLIAATPGALASNELVATVASATIFNEVDVVGDLSGGHAAADPAAPATGENGDRFYVVVQGTHIDPKHDRIVLLTRDAEGKEPSCGQGDAEVMAIAGKSTGGGFAGLSCEGKGSRQVQC